MDKIKKILKRFFCIHSWKYSNPNEKINSNNFPTWKEFECVDCGKKTKMFD